MHVSLSASRMSARLFIWPSVCLTFTLSARLIIGERDVCVCWSWADGGRGQTVPPPLPHFSGSLKFHSGNLLEQHPNMPVFIDDF